MLKFTRVQRYLLIVIMPMFGVSCTSMQLKDLFSAYSQQMSGVRAAQQAGDFVQAESLVNDLSANQNNYALSLLEKGRLHFLAQDWTASKTDFNQAFISIEQQQAKAKIQISKGLANAGAVVSNDNVIDYDVPPYEQSLLHTYQALNYLYLGQLESALVEIRRANLVQENALKQNQAELLDAESKFNQNALKQNYPSMAAMVGKLKNGFQNAYTFYLSGVLYEAASQANDAYIDYKRALEIFPDNQYLQQDVLRLATALNMTDDLSQLVSRYGEYQAPTPHSADLVIIVERGIISPKSELALNLPIFTRRNDMRFFSFALPVYQGLLSQYSPLNLSLAENTYKTQEIVRIQSLASKQLQEQLPGLMTRQAVRVVAKEQLRSSLSKEGGAVGNILAGIYNLASEHADTRSWSTLPDEVQILRLAIPSGHQILNVSVQGQTHAIDITPVDGRTTLIYVNQIGQHFVSKVTNL